MSLPIETFAPLLAAIQKEGPIPIYNERKNSGRGRTLPMGIINRRNYGVGHSRNNALFPTIYSEAVKLGQQLAANHKWTAIIINEDYQAKPHRDKNNNGISTIVSFGDFENGELIVEDIGSIVTKHTPYQMDASKLTHSVADFVGKRYSIIWFNPTFPKTMRHLQELSFDELNERLGHYTDAASKHRLL